MSLISNSTSEDTQCAKNERFTLSKKYFVKLILKLLFAKPLLSRDFCEKPLKVNFRSQFHGIFGGKVSVLNLRDLFRIYFFFSELFMYINGF